MNKINFLDFELQSHEDKPMHIGFLNPTFNRDSVV